MQQMIYPSRRLTLNKVPSAAILLTLLVGLVSCQKEELRSGLSFEEIHLPDIQARKGQLSDENILATDSTGLVLEICEILLYRTNSGRYGKMKILSIDPADNYRLTVQAVTYQNDGTIFSEAESLEIRGTYTGDLDGMLESGPQNDFHWRRENDTETSLDPRGSAVFAHY